jgi:RNA polymerase sigma factor (sigma-70 family)
MLIRNQLSLLVAAAQGGDVRAFAELVEATQKMAYAVAWRVVRQEPDARDIIQDAYLVAFKRLSELLEAEAFPGWLRRIVIATALNHRRHNRGVWTSISDQVAPPILDDDERRWSDEQQRQLARALLTLSEDERRACERYYYGGWSVERIASHTGIHPAAMRKRLQRIRDKLRKELEMDEQQILGDQRLPQHLSENITELLARPRLAELPENPVGAVAALFRAAFPGFSSIELPETLDLDVAQERLGGDAVYIDRDKLHRIEGERVLRYDLTLPLLLEVRGRGAPQRLSATGKAYRQETESATHLEAFHQLEVFAIDEKTALDPWSFAGRILNAVDRVLPRAEVRVTPTEYSMCRRAWSLDVLNNERWVEVLAWGEYADWVLKALGADPEVHAAVGAGCGLERLAMLKYAIDDIRKVALASVA